MNSYLPYLGAVIVAAGLGSYFTNIGLHSNTYILLKKPSWYPPGYVFGIVWSIIYVLYSYSWSKIPNISWITILFGLNMILNVLWCYVFFSLQNFVGALLILIALVGTLVFQIISLYNYDKTASLLLIPYLLWSSFATFLNYTIIQMN